MWNGGIFKRINVYVDLAPAVESDNEPDKPLPLGVKPRNALLIPKTSCHVKNTTTHYSMSLTLTLNKR